MNRRTLLSMLGLAPIAGALGLITHPKEPTLKAGSIRADSIVLKVRKFRVGGIGSRPVTSVAIPEAWVNAKGESWGL